MNNSAACPPNRANHKVLLCSTCGFAFDPWLKHWECRTDLLGLASGALPGFPSLIRNLPLPQQKKEQDGVRYSQIRSGSTQLSDACFYWTSADFDFTKAQIRDYLKSVGFAPEETSRPYVGRVYSQFFARAGDRFLHVEVMLESNRQVAVDARLLAPSEIEHDYPLREALKIAEPNKPPQTNTGGRPSSEDSPASGTPSSPAPRG